MTHRPGSHVLLAIGLVVALPAAGCGSSSKAKTSSSFGSSSTTTTAAPTTTTIDRAADAAGAKALVLTAADLPPDWKGTPHTQDASEKADNKQLVECLGTTEPDDTANVDGDDFDKDNAEVSSSADVVPTRADFEADVAALKGPKLQPCIETELKASLQRQSQQESQGPTFDNVTFTKLPSATLGEVTEAFRVAVDVHTGGQTGKVYVDFVLFGKSRSEMTLSFLNVGAPFDQALEQSLVAKAGAKLSAAR